MDISHKDQATADPISQSVTVINGFRLLAGPYVLVLRLNQRERIGPEYESGGPIVLRNRPPANWSCLAGQLYREHETITSGIDEVQFFDNELIAIANGLAVRGLRVISPDWIRITRASPGADAAAARRRGIHHQDSRHLHEVRPVGELQPAHFRI